MGRVSFEYQNSSKLTAALVDHIVAQDSTGVIDAAEVQKIRYNISKDRLQRQRATLQDLLPNMSEEMRRRVHTAQEVGASNWLTTLPLRAKGFSLNKQEFNDALALRYGWPVDGLPNLCVCGTTFGSDHAMVCKKGGFICMRHDEVRDLTAEMLKEVCRDVSVEPPLLPLNGEVFSHQTANTSNDARVDLCVGGCWTRGQRAFFDVRIFDPMAACYRDLQLDAAHKRNEAEKIRAYEERIQNVDQGSFTPLVFTTAGDMAPRAMSFYNRLAELLAERRRQSKSLTVAWMRCRLSFSLLRSALLCLRGTRSMHPRLAPVSSTDCGAVVAESRLDRRLE